MSKILEDRNTVYLGRDEKGSDVYTTRSVVAEWQALRADLTALQTTRPRTLYPEHAVLLRERPTLSVEQRAAVDAVTAGYGLSVVTGYAGAGKSTMLDEARRIWHRSCRRAGR